MLNTTRSSSKDTITLDGVSMTCTQLVSAATQKNKVTLADGAADRIVSGREVVQNIVSSGTPGYGITTGVGSQKDFKVAAEGAQDYNRRLARAHATHAGGAVAQKPGACRPDHSG